MPCLIRNKYVPIVVTALVTGFNYEEFLPVLLASLFGYLQYFVLKRDLLLFPISVYRKFDAIIPISIKSRHDYVITYDV